jgi:hypothetical protein
MRCYLGACSASMMSQAAECMQQAIQWASTLVQQLARLEAGATLQAVVSRLKVLFPICLPGFAPCWSTAMLLNLLGASELFHCPIAVTRHPPH